MQCLVLSYLLGVDPYTFPTWPAWDQRGVSWTAPLSLVKDKCRLVAIHKMLALNVEVCITVFVSLAAINVLSI